MIYLFLVALLMQTNNQTNAAPSTQPVPAVPGATVVALAPTMTFLVVPDDLKLSDGTVDVLLHLKGSPQRVFQSLKSSNVSAIAIVVTDGGFSKAYTDRFADPESLQWLLDEAMRIVRQRPDVPDDAKVGRLWISSFSAGYAAVRELRKHDR